MSNQLPPGMAEQAKASMATADKLLDFVLKNMTADLENEADPVIRYGHAVTVALGCYDRDPGILADLAAVALLRLVPSRDS